MEGHGIGLIKELSRDFPGGTEENYKDPSRDCRYRGRDPNQAPSEYMSRALPLQYPAYNRSKPNTLFPSFQLISITSISSMRRSPVLQHYLYTILILLGLKEVCIKTSHCCVSSAWTRVYEHAMNLSQLKSWLTFMAYMYIWDMYCGV
jgi:hypothetical protein